MAIQRTFSIIKPDATRRNLTGQINAMIEGAGLRIVAQRRVKLSKEAAEGFYAVHAERPFFNSLVEFMTSGPVVVQVLEGEDAIAAYRKVMGATKPGRCRRGYHSQVLRRIHRSQLGSWFRQPGERRNRNQILLLRPRYRRLSIL